MNKVYICCDMNWDNSIHDIVGVYTTEKKAKNAYIDYIIENELGDLDDNMDNCLVVECEINA